MLVLLQSVIEYFLKQVQLHGKKRGKFAKQNSKIFHISKINFRAVLVDFIEQGQLYQLTLK